MAHGGYARRREEGRRPRVPHSHGIDKKRSKKSKAVTLKNQIRSTERLLRKDLPPEVRLAQEKKLEDLKNQHDVHTRLARQRQIQLRDKKIKFFERRKTERMIRRLEKQQRASSDPAEQGKVSDQLSKLREDLEYVRFFPKTEKYISLFVGGENPDIVEKRSKLRKQIKANLIAAAASGKDLEETASDDDALSNDDFFLSGSSNDEAEADDEWTDKSTREPASSASGKATSGMSSDEKHLRQRSARLLMPPPRPAASHRNRSIVNAVPSTSSNTSDSRNASSARYRRPLYANVDSNSNLSSNSDARKPRRKRRPKKRRQT